MSANPFVLPNNQYVRQLDPIGDYIKQTAHMCAIQTGTTIEQATEFVTKNLGPNGLFPFNPPRVKFTERQENGDRCVKIDTIYNYIQDALNNQDLIAPTFTRYVNHKRKTSMLVGYIEGNIKRRNVAKKEMFAAKRNKDTMRFVQKKNQQNNRKLGNNAISGSHVSPYTILYNKTAHSTLTSNCRSTSGFGNANNEKMLSGNRHYHNPDIVMFNITAIITITDTVELEAVMQEYNLTYPTVEDVMSCIMYSFHLYNRDPQWPPKFQAYVEKLSPIQRAAFLYIGDFYQIAKLNPQFARDFITKMIQRKHRKFEKADMATLYSFPEDNINLAAQIINNDLRGKKTEDIQETYLFEELLATSENVTLVSQEYSSFIKAIFVTRNVPASLGYFPDSIRRSALTSDTDSTIFTVQDWVEWYCGSINFGDTAMGVAALMVWMSSQTIIHILAMMSANFGVDETRTKKIAMKNEFKFDVFVPTSRSKHYFALIGCQEGIMFDEYGKEIKGVHLKSSNCPPFVNKAGEDMMMYIMNSVLEGRQISMDYCIRTVMSVEQRVHDEINAAHPAYFRRGAIRPLASYSDKRPPHQTNYFHYMMWSEVFAPKYGGISEPPYDVTKVSVDLDSPVKIRAWLEAMEDRDMAHRFETFLTKYGKKQIGTMYIPRQTVRSTGMPKELIPVVGVRNMVKDITSIFKLILETVGMRVNEDFLFYENY